MQARFHVLFCLIGKFVSYHTKKHVYAHVFYTKIKEDGYGGI